MKSCKWVLILMIGLLALTGCGGDDDEEETADTGTLVFTMNGEDFIRDGFVTEDGWTMSFEHVYLTIEEPTAYQVPETTDTSKKTVSCGSFARRHPRRRCQRNSLGKLHAGSDPGYGSAAPSVRSRARQSETTIT